MNSKGKKNNNNARKTYFRIKSAGNARPEKMQGKFRQNNRNGFVQRMNQYNKKAQ